MNGIVALSVINPLLVIIPPPPAAADPWRVPLVIVGWQNTSLCSLEERIEGAGRYVGANPGKQRQLKLFFLEPPKKSLTHLL